MRKFKHKITKDVAIMKSNNSSFYTYDGMDIHARIVENSNDWEEVTEEKEYEITAYQHGCGKIYPVTSDHSFNYNNVYYRIYSIKRLSDGEVFTIGDRTENLNNFYDGDNKDHGKIHSIRLEDGKITVGILHSGGFFLNTVIKAKQPLFTTEDGKKIFKGDQSYFVTTSFYLHGPSTYHGGGEHSGKYFSTREAAEEYIIENKPVLSLKEILSQSIICDWGHDFRTKLHQLVKQKLNL